MHMYTGTCPTFKTHYSMEAITACIIALHHQTWFAKYEVIQHNPRIKTSETNNKVSCAVTV